MDVSHCFHSIAQTSKNNLKRTNLPLQNAAWSDLRGFSTSLADMLNVIWQALKESVNKIGSKGS